MNMNLRTIGITALLLCTIFIGAAYASPVGTTTPPAEGAEGVWINWGGYWYDLRALYMESNNGSDEGWGGPDFSLTIDSTGIYFNTGSIIPDQLDFGSGFQIYNNNQTYSYGEAGASFNLINNEGSFFLTESGQIPMSRTPEPLSIGIMLIGLAGIGISRTAGRK